MKIERISYLDLLTEAVLAAKPKMTRKAAQKLVIKSIVATRMAGGRQQGPAHPKPTRCGGG